jgi:hypothetical protein
VPDHLFGNAVVPDGALSADAARLELSDLFWKAPPFDRFENKTPNTGPRLLADNQFAQRGPGIRGRVHNYSIKSLTPRSGRMLDNLQLPVLQFRLSSDQCGRQSPAFLSIVLKPMIF